MTASIAKTHVDIVRARRLSALRRRRREHHRYLVGLSDRTIERLERLNLAEGGGAPPDRPTADAIDETLRAMPEPVRRRFPGRRTVQQALDGLFAVQDALQRAHQADLPGAAWDDLDDLDAW